MGTSPVSAVEPTSTLLGYTREKLAVNVMSKRAPHAAPAAAGPQHPQSWHVPTTAVQQALLSSQHHPHHQPVQHHVHFAQGTFESRSHRDSHDGEFKIKSRPLLPSRDGRTHMPAGSTPHASSGRPSAAAQKPGRQTPGSVVMHHQCDGRSGSHLSSKSDETPVSACAQQRTRRCAATPAGHLLGRMVMTDEEDEEDGLYREEVNGKRVCYARVLQYPVWR